MRNKTVIPENFLEVFNTLVDLIPDTVIWAIDGSCSLLLQDLDVVPGDIDILTDETGAYDIERSLKKYSVKAVKYSSNEKYESHFGSFLINGVKVEVMGNLRVFRNGEWTKVQNPETVRIEKIKVQGIELPIVSLRSSMESGYADERVHRE